MARRWRGDSQWVYDFPSNFVTLTNENIPFKLIDVDMDAGTATLTFATSGRVQWNDLAGGTPFTENDVFGTTRFVPEPSTGLLLATALLALAAGRRGR